MKRQIELFEAAMAACEAGIAATRPGTTAGAIGTAGLKTQEDRGFPVKGVFSALGHGIGLGWDSPWGARDDATPMVPNMVLNYERTISADGWLRTGDLGTVDPEGNLRFRGRLKELVKTGGINVSPTEIEAVLMTHPGVEHALVAGVPDPVRDEVLAAVIVPRKGCAPSEDELRAHCRAQLAVYKVPSLMRFTTESALPLTTTGKVIRRLLREKAVVEAKN